MEHGILDVILKGGLAVYISFYPLIALSIWSIAVIIKRFLVMQEVEKKTADFMKQIGEMLDNNDKEGVINLCQTSLNPVSSIINEAMEKFEKIKDKVSLRECRVRLLETQQHTRTLENAKLNKGMPVLATVGSNAPFIGLLGTVVGIMAAFSDIARSGSGGFAVISASISEALITTALGLGVAIPAVVGYNYFAGRIDNFMVMVDGYAGRTVDILLFEKLEEE